MRVIGSILRWASVASAVFVVLGFVYFAADETAKGSSETVAGLTDEAVAESEREEQNGSVREFVEDANDVLVSPFENIVISDDAWVSNGVPALLAVFVYGIGVLMLLNYLVPARER